MPTTNRQTRTLTDGLSVQLNTANTLTWIRIAAIPLFVVLYYWPSEWGRPLSAVVFMLAAITDWLDGYVARKLGQITPFGEFLDPVADKLIVAVALILLVQTDQRLSLALVAAIIVGREITVSALREWMAGLGQRTTVAVSMVGKVKTTFQMAGLTLMVWREDILDLPVYEAGFWLLLLAAGLTLWSMYAYLKAAWPVLNADS
jgi:CDP-diacylglycerol--glycerol-3-phosphate 3-phosphatidyltransferase